MGYINTIFLGKEYSIPQDVLSYIDLLVFTETMQKQLATSFVRMLNKKLQQGDTGLLDDEDLNPEIEQQVGKFIAKLCDNGIFTRTIRDYLDNNKGYQYVSDVNKAALEAIKSFLLERLNSMQEGLEEAGQKADSRVTGMGFSIISGSFVNHAIYAAMEASTLSKQEKEADAIWRKETHALTTRLEADYNKKCADYITGKYIPNMEAAFTVLSYELLDRYISDLIVHNKFDRAALNFVNIGRSNDLLNNLTLSNNKKAILENAFTACPYNIAVYMQTMKYDLLDYDSFQTAKVFKQDHHVLSFFRDSWGEAAFPIKFNIDYDCIKKWAYYTDKTPEELLRGLTDQYTTGIVKAYARIADMLADEYLCRKVLGEYSEDVLLSGEAVCRNKAREYVTSIAPVCVWEQLTKKCGHTDLLDCIKSHFSFITENSETINELNTYLIEQLYTALESARNILANKIKKEKRRAQEREKEEARIRREEVQLRTKRNQKIAIVVALLAVVFISVMIVVKIIVPSVRYNNAVALMEAERYAEAIHAFHELNGYKDSNVKIDDCQNVIVEIKYQKALELFNSKQYSESLVLFGELNNYKDSVDKYCVALVKMHGDNIVDMMQGSWHSSGEYLCYYIEINDRTVLKKYHSSREFTWEPEEYHWNEDGFLETLEPRNGNISRVTLRLYKDSILETIYVKNGNVLSNTYYPTDVEVMDD